MSLGAKQISEASTHDESCLFSFFLSIESSHSRLAPTLHAPLHAHIFTQKKPLALSIFLFLSLPLPLPLPLPLSLSLISHKARAWHGSLLLCKVTPVVLLQSSYTGLHPQTLSHLEGKLEAREAGRELRVPHVPLVHAILREHGQARGDGRGLGGREGGGRRQEEVDVAGEVLEAGRELRVAHVPVEAVGVPRRDEGGGLARREDGGAGRGFGSVDRRREPLDESREVEVPHLRDGTRLVRRGSHAERLKLRLGRPNDLAFDTHGDVAGCRWVTGCGAQAMGEPTWTVLCGGDDGVSGCDGGDVKLLRW